MAKETEKVNISQSKNAEKKQVPLRLSPTLYADLAAWAEDDFRSINGQIEYLRIWLPGRRMTSAPSTVRLNTF